MIIMIKRQYNINIYKQKTESLIFVKIFHKNFS